MRAFLTGCATTLAFCAVVLVATGIAQTESVARFSGTSQNVSGAGESIRINIYQWSTDPQRDAILAAWTTGSITGGAVGARGGRGGGAPAGRGAPAARGGTGPRAGRGAPANPAGPAVPPEPGPDPALLNGLADPSDNVPADAPAAAPAPGRGGRGGARGGGGGAPATPEAALGAMLKSAATVGVFWTSESVGYAIKYAHRMELPGGAERIILITDRRVGASNSSWTPTPASPASEYPFSIIDLRVTPGGQGEGKGVVTGKVSVDSAARTISVDGYETLPTILRVDRR